VGVGAVVLVAVASVAVLVSARVGRDQALRQPMASGALVATRIVAPLVTQGVYSGDTKDLSMLDQRVGIRKAGSAIERIKVWSRDGVILYSDDPRLIGQRFPLDPLGIRAVTSQGVESTVTDLSRSNNLLDRQLGESVQVYAGTQDRTGRQILVETYYSMDELDADQATVTRRIVGLVLASLLVFGLLLVPLAYSLARRTARASASPDSPGTTDDPR
jgi:two-component system NarL family sensor kinase